VSITPTSWPGFGVQDLNEVETPLRRNARDKYTYRELRSFAERLRDRLKQSPYRAQINLVAVQTYLDCVGRAGRGEEAAQTVFEQLIEPSFAKASEEWR
jgi:hypothetical protein